MPFHNSTTEMLTVENRESTFSEPKMCGLLVKLRIIDCATAGISSINSIKNIKSTCNKKNVALTVLVKFCNSHGYRPNRSADFS